MPVKSRIQAHGKLCSDLTPYMQRLFACKIIFAVVESGWISARDSKKGLFRGFSASLQLGARSAIFALFADGPNNIL